MLGESVNSAGLTIDGAGARGAAADSGAILAFSPEQFSWGDTVVPDPLLRGQKLVLGSSGFLVFKSVVDARACRIETTAATPANGNTALTLSIAPESREVRVLLPLKGALLSGVPRGATATFLLRFSLKGSEATKPLEWVALLATHGSPALRFWRKIAEKVAIGERQVCRLRFQVVLAADEEIPEQIYLAIQAPPGAGWLKLGDVTLNRESVITDLGALTTDSDDALEGWVRSEQQDDLWLESVSSAGSPARLKLERGGGVFELVHTRRLLKFRAPWKKLAPLLPDRGDCTLFLRRGTETLALTEIEGKRRLPPPPPAPPPAIAKSPRDAGTLKADNPEALAELLRGFLETEVTPRVEAHIAAQQWAELASFQRLLLPEFKAYERLLLLVGRGALSGKDFNLALRCLGAGALLFPSSEKIQYFCGSAHIKAGRPLTAVGYFRAALDLSPDALRTKLALADALRLAATKSRDPAERLALMDEAVIFFHQAADDNDNAKVAWKLARLLHSLARNEEALDALDRVLAGAPNDIDARLLKSRILVSLNRLAEALAIATEVAKFAPLNQAARFQIRALRDLVEDGEPRPPASFGDLLRADNGTFLSGPVGQATAPFAADTTSGADHLATALVGLPYDWLRLADRPTAGSTKLIESVDAFRGFCEHLEAGMPPCKLWRREAILQLAESGLIRADLSNLPEFENLYGPRPVYAGGPRTAALLSRHGSVKFGGGEQFLDSMAEHYRSVGYDPILVAVRDGAVEFMGEEDGRRYAIVNANAADLRRFFAQAQVQLVHTVGLGALVADALSYTNIPFIYGVHFWREVLGSDNSDSAFFDADGHPVPRLEFRYVLARAATVYANSHFTRQVIEKCFGVRCPVVYSVPRELEFVHGT